MNAEQPGSSAGPPLGELLVSPGLITPEQLEQALADQRDSGRPLGEIFVRLGFTNGPIIAQALTTHQGGMLKSEYGFATGFDAIFAENGAEGEPPPVTIRDTVRPALAPVEGAVLPQAETLRLASPPPSRVAAGPAPQIVPAVEESAAASAQPDEEKGRMAAHIGTLESQLTNAKAAIEASLRSRKTETSELRETVVRLEAELSQALRERDVAGVQLHAASEAHAVLRGEIERLAPQLAAALAERDSALAERDAVLASSESSIAPAEESSHLLFFAAASRGYVLLQRPGPGPAVGDVVDTSADGGTAYAYVTKVARPPIPGPRLRCAYLL